ncbi:MAG: adenylate/guanylate cyclase domain-containing protein [Rhodovibrionaceae bacterium]|nr:adenylate/guanylate cyclase domain-containing protein [Rhodovibrionaceae bacterium]
MERRLTTVLAADVVGYSRLMGQDEDATLDALKALRKELVTPLIQEHGGRTVKLMGDGLLAEFGSVAGAVKCAIAIQTGVQQRNQSVDPEREILLRIGINPGDVIVEGRDIYGDGVNIAARLEAMAPPGGICISGAAYDTVEGKLDCDFEDLGPQRVKNIAKPVRAYRVAAVQKESGRPAESEIFSAILARPAVAVLPFDNMSGDPDQEYFSDGLSEDLITALAHWRSFPVIARNSSFAYKGKSMDVKQIGRELGARYILEGSVRKSAARVRITAQLIDTTSAHHVWAERYDRKFEDIFDLQDEITKRIVATVEPALDKAELRRSKAKPPDNLDAWDFCLRGRAYMHEWRPEATAKARDMFQRAIELDPDYSEAHADLAWTHSRDLLVESTRDRKASAAKMYEAARRAVELDDASALARYRLSSAHIWRDEHDLALAEGRRAVELNPMHAVARHALANKLDLVGDPQGIPMMIEAEQLNPRDPQRNMQLTFLARAYVNAGDYEKAVQCAKEALQVHPDFPNAYYILAVAYGHLGEREKARAALEECDRAQPGFSERRSGWAPYVDPASNEHLHEGLRKVGLES